VKHSFLATIAYGFMALAMVFMANLAGWMATGALAHAVGVALAIAATGFAYLAQHYFTTAACAQESIEARLWMRSGEDPRPEMAATASKRGGGWQVASVAFATFAACMFLLGALS
jgi:hypothetical protein